MTGVDIKSNNLENLVVGKLAAKWSARGDRILRYYIDLRHEKLNLHKEVSAPELSILQSKLDALMAGWDQKYEAYLKKQELASGQNAADELTAEATAKLDSLRHILQHTLKVDDTVDWESLKDKREYDYPKSFSEPKPASHPAKKPVYEEPKFGLIDIVLDLVVGKKVKVVAAAEERFAEQMAAWEQSEDKRQKALVHASAEWEKREKTFWAYHDAENKHFDEEQSAAHAEVERLRDSVSKGDEQAVIEHASLVLESSDYNGLLEKSYLLQYTADSKLLKIAYDMPSLEQLPTTKVVRFVKSTGELKETAVSQREQKATFDSVSYQICLRTLHEIFEADEYSNIDSILFNGFVNFVDRATGLESRSCLLSILVDRDSFCAIDLSRVEPKSCFKSLKGVSASSLASLTPIPPVMELETEDRRFVEGREVGSEIDNSTNLAAVSWEDFEHLVRELFEKEFATRGGEVKVTQSSSDGGVDAIAFDPDPITGGKIVIQAKRYTRTVGVSAVRDLFGTVMNEGASKGILVTTADYGPDAYNFVKDKPITLMNGANLLHMLEKHGYEAKIDIKEARVLMQ